ncbi:MAG TPA: mannosyltransferase family protein [Candidatus Baltobacteraceae bacterium]
MSIHVSDPNGTRSRSSSTSELLAAGWLAPIVTTLAGLTLGFFFWFAVMASHRNAALTQIGLLPCVLAGAAAVLWAWRAYAHYFSRRTGVTFARALRYDALTWLPFLLLWLTFFMSPGVTHGSRLLAVCLGLFAAAKIGIAARFNQTVREVLLEFVVTRIAIVMIAELAAVIVGQRPGTHVEESSHVLLAVWGRWDAVHYINVATHGYEGTDVAFFPLLSLLIRIVGTLSGSHLIAGLAISNVSFFFGLLFLYKLLEHEFDRSVARRAVFYVSIFPSAVFFSAVYTESLFFMLTIASFYYMRERKWWLAGAIGFFAALTRVEGVLLAVPFFIEWWGVHRARVAGAWQSSIAGALIPAGLLVYMAYLWVLRGDALAFSHVQAHWNRHFAPPWVALSAAFAQMAHASQAQTVANQALELAFTILMVGVLVGGWRSLRPSYIAYMALSVLVPMSTSSLMSMPRFALVLFPMFAIMGRWGEKPWINNAIVAFSLPLLGLFTVLFADWYWVA